MRDLPLQLHMNRVLLLVAILVAGCGRPEPPPDPVQQRAEHLQALFEAIQPVKLANCEFERVGDKDDGGYVICKNLVNRAESLYWYGISATDNWGCTLSARLQKPVHQYDCFNLERPQCEALPVFHEECVGPARETIEGRRYDTVEAQMARNGDAGKRVVMKMDVEGSEWASFLDDASIRDAADRSAQRRISRCGREALSRRRSIASGASSTWSTFITTTGRARRASCRCRQRCSKCCS